MRSTAPNNCSIGSNTCVFLCFFEASARISGWSLLSACVYTHTVGRDHTPHTHTHRRLWSHTWCMCGGVWSRQMVCVMQLWMHHNSIGFTVCRGGHNVLNIHHTYIWTHTIHTYMNTHHTYIHEHTPYIHTWTHTIHTYEHTPYIHTWTHTIHTYMNTHHSHDIVRYRVGCSEDVIVTQ